MKYKIVPLTNGKETIVDEDLYEVLSKYKWCAHFSGIYYAERNFLNDKGEKRTMKMHHAVIGYPLNNLKVHHINGNGLDNRRNNLRIVSHRENCSNRSDLRNRQSLR